MYTVRFLHPVVAFKSHKLPALVSYILRVAKHLKTAGFRV